MALSANELLKRALLGRSLDWRKKLENLDAASAKRVLQILAVGDNKIREAVKKDLPAILKRDYKRADIVLWARDATEPIAENLVDTIADSWTVSALESIRAYNDILTFGGAAKAVQPIPESIDELKKLAAGRPFQNRSLRELIDAVFVGGVGGSIVATIDAGMREGHGYEKIVKKLLKETLPGGQTMTRRDAITLSRSYIQQASVNAQLATYWAYREVIKGVRWTAILDNRVCMKCAALDGTAYSWEDKKPGLIAHPRCRCLWLPMVKSYRELGLDIDDVERAARPYVVREAGNVDTGGRKILYAGTSKEDFGGWWKTLPYKEQIKSVGVVRTKLLNAGEISWDDLIDKSSGRIFTLHELGFTQGGKALAVVAGGAGAVAATTPATSVAKPFTPVVQPVQTEQELNNQIKHHVPPFTNFEYTTKYHMATDGVDKLYIGTRTQIDTIDPTNSAGSLSLNAKQDLMSAWNKLATGKDLNIQEELALQALDHEKGHTQQVKTKTRMGKPSIAIMETVNEWVSRRTYHTTIASLGGSARYQKEIIENGAGYWRYIKNFDAMRDKFGIADDPAFFAVMDNIHKTVPRDKYKKALCDVFFKAGKGKIGRKYINGLLGHISDKHNTFALSLKMLFPNP